MSILSESETQIKAIQKYVLFVIQNIIAQLTASLKRIKTPQRVSLV